LHPGAKRAITRNVWRTAATIAACLGAIACGPGGSGQAAGPAAPIEYEVTTTPAARVAGEVPPCERGDDLPASAGGPIAGGARGVILDAAGAPVEAAQVTITGRARTLPDGHRIRIPGKTSTWTNYTGGFRFVSLEPEMDDITVVHGDVTVTCRRGVAGDDPRGYVIRLR
jgi:hypothetical protein